MYRLKKIDLSSVALYSFFMFLIMGFVFLLPFGLVGIFISEAVQEAGFPNQPGPDIFAFFSGAFLIILPLIYAIFGTFINIIIALIYNLLSLKLGGLKFSIHKIGEVENITS